MTAKPAPEVEGAYRRLFSGVFEEIMDGLVKADPNAPIYLGFGKKRRDLTEKDVKRIAELASDYYVEHANPSVRELSKRKVRGLKERAIEDALKRFVGADEN